MHTDGIPDLRSNVPRKYRMGDKGGQEPFLDQNAEYDGRGRRIEKVGTNSGQAKVLE